MLNKKHKLTFFIIATVFLSSCAGPRIWPEQRGQVLEAGTNKPIEGAIVVAVWNGRLNVAFVDSQSTCYHEEVTTTDSEGGYKIEPRFDGIMTSHIFNKGTTTHVYKAGYVYSDEKYILGNRNNTIFYLKKFSPLGDNRFEGLLIVPRGCGYSINKSKDVLLSHYEKIAQVAHVIYLKNDKFTKNFMKKYYLLM